MIPVSTLVRIDKSISIPVYLQVANSLIALIQQGSLKPGAALPPSRALAKSLHVHRKTIIAAYDELYAQNWIDVFPRKGVFVAKNLPVISARPILPTGQAPQRLAETWFTVDQDPSASRLFVKGMEGNLVFNDGFPDPRLVPVDLLVREFRRFASYRFTTKYLWYGPEQGSENLRNELAHFLSETRGLLVDPKHILITKGVQMALYLSAQLLLSPGDSVIVGEPGYFMANDVFEQAGAKLELVPVDEQGMDIDAVEVLCQQKQIRLLYVIPHHHTPTTVTLSSQRRMRLLELAKQYRFAILEDDYDFDFHYTSSPVLPLASADYYGSVIYVGSFCKTIAPGIRIGFMIAPSNLLSQATRLRRLIDRQGEQLLEEAMASLLKNGDIGRHLKKANKCYQERRDVLCQLLQDQLPEHIAFRVPDGGFAVWVTYLHGLDPAKVAQKAAKLGLTVGDGNAYYYDKTHKSQSVRLGFASLNPSELVEAVSILKKAIQ